MTRNFKYIEYNKTCELQHMLSITPGVYFKHKDEIYMRENYAGYGVYHVYNVTSNKPGLLGIHTEVLPIMLTSH